MANSLLYGFYQLKDLANQRAIETRRDVLQAAIVNSVAEHNREINAMLALFAAPITDYQLRFQTPTNNRLQPGDENSRALPVKFSGYNVAFPIQKGDTAWGTNFITRQKMTVQDVNDNVANMLNGDVNWMRDHMLAALFYNGAGWTFPDPQYGDLTIQGLANGDTVTYLKTGAAAAIDTHQLATASAIADATNPYPTIYAELAEHPENQGSDYVVFIASDLVATTTALADFAPVVDTNVRPAANDIAAIGNPGFAVPGSARLLGRTSSMWIYEWGWVPSGYMIALATDGPRPLAMRQDPEPELQGFVAADPRSDFPYSENQYFRRAGFGAWNRVGAVIQRIGNGSYAIPTSYGSPMY